tara:strand:- start:2427 stop:3251 length:825 start_codon:yes stop_codon:yes gene_type:complete
MFNRIFFLVIVFALINSNFSSAQTNELGIFFGGSLFHGDLGFQNSENSFMSSRPSYGINIKRNINYYFGLNLSLKRSIIQAKDSSSEDLFNKNRDLDFRSSVTDLSLLFEFNFQPYSSRDSEYNNSFFIYSGISRFNFNPQRQSENGFWYNLRPLNTEGQGSDFYPGRKPYDLSTFAIPVGIGYKVNIIEYLTLSFHMSWRFTFTDYLDDVSTSYVEPSVQSPLTLDLSDNLNESYPVGFQRGDPNNFDKYGFFGISILYSIKDPSKECIDIIK